MHLESIESGQKKVFSEIKAFRNFYLVGGTALALQMGHRISVDFDLFSDKKNLHNLLGKVERVFKNFKRSVVISNPDQLSVKVNGVKIDFVGYPFPPVMGFIKFEGVNILTIPEIAAMKAQTLGRRPALKDYIDLYFILKDEDLDLNKIIKIAEEKFGDEFNARLFLEQLVYLQDVSDMKINFIKEAVTRDQLQVFFENEIKKIKI